MPRPITSPYNIITTTGLYCGRKLGRIFEIFYRATTEASGTGLGLHIVKDTITRLNGKIEVKSKLGEGTMFKVSLPILYSLVRVLYFRSWKESGALIN